MKCLLAIILGIAVYGNLVASQNCYTCAYTSGVEGVIDACTDANFDSDSGFVQETPCTGQCAIIESEISGVSTFSRSCGAAVCGQEIPGTTTTCCDGNLCNGPSGGGGGDAGGDAGGGAGDGNQCYACLDITGYGCDNDNFDQDQASMVTCSGSCVKEWGMALGIEYSSRGCATNDQGVETVCSENSCDSQSAFGISVESCRFCCDGELCNGAGSVVISTAVILSATAVSALLVMIF